jgi:hypothetical protein
MDYQKDIVSSYAAKQEVMLSQAAKVTWFFFKMKSLLLLGSQGLTQKSYDSDVHGGSLPLALRLISCDYTLTKHRKKR